MFNPHLDGVTIVFTSIVAVQSLIAVFINVKSAMQGWAVFSKMRFSIAAASFVLACGYAHLLFTDINPGDWTKILRGVTIAIWPVVYWWPAWLSLREYRRVLGARDELIVKVLTEQPYPPFTPDVLDASDTLDIEDEVPTVGPS